MSTRNKQLLFLGLLLGFIIPFVGAHAIQTIPLDNPIQGNPSIEQVFGGIITAVLGIIGSITLVVFMYGGFLWLTSAGNADKVKQGTQAMLYGIIGLFIIFSAYAILNTIITGIRGGGRVDAGAGSPTGIPNQPDESCLTLFGSEGFQCLPIASCEGLRDGATWQDCRNAPAGVCKVNRCGEAAGVVCCKPKN